ncbi:hypothetical protein B0H10DRAFT_1969171 [Mycena sp. CBHHK59/15]|nr:hypothetical protein B0H10DRAFT_1969171 [Mycena sp. CBHHK59/15]
MDGAAQKGLAHPVLGHGNGQRPLGPTSRCISALGTTEWQQRIWSWIFCSSNFPGPLRFPVGRKKCCSQTMKQLPQSHTKQISGAVVLYNVIGNYGSICNETHFLGPVSKCQWCPIPTEPEDTGLTEKRPTMRIDLVPTES